MISSVFYSVSLDTTYDISRKEQLSIVLGYINKKMALFVNNWWQLEKHY